MQEKENEIKIAKKELANLYLLIKMQKKDNVRDIILYKFDYKYCIQYKIISENKEDLEEITKISFKELVEYIKNSLDIIVEYKLSIEIENFKNNYKNLSEVIEYEELLQQAEERIRKLISIELTLKLQCEKYAQKIDTLEKEKNKIETQLVRIILNKKYFSQINERLDFSTRLEDISKKLEKFQKKFDIEKIKKDYENTLKDKDQEIFESQKKIAYLLNKIKFLENKIYMNSFNDDNKNINQNKKNHSIFQQEDELLKYKTSRVGSNRTKFNKKEKERERNQYNSLYVIPHSKRKNRRMLIKSMSSSFINQSNVDNETYMYKNKYNSSIGESINNFIFNINDNSLIKDNTDKLRLNPDSVQTINIEKIKVQKKLMEYRKLIDRRLNDLKSNKRYHNKKIIRTSNFIKLKLFDNNGKHISSSKEKDVTNLDKNIKKAKCIYNKSHRSINRTNFKIS